MSATDKIKNAIEDVEGKAKEALGHVRRPEHRDRGPQATRPSPT